jgi:hypothetical protein
MGILNRITGNRKVGHEDYGKGIGDMNFLADSKHPQQQSITAMSEKQFSQLLEHIPHMPKEKQQSMIGKLLSGSASAAGKLVSVHGKKLSLEGKIINKHLYAGKGMSELVNPLGIAISSDPMDIYKVPRPKMATQMQVRQKLSMFGVTKLRVF